MIHNQATGLKSNMASNDMVVHTLNDFFFGNDLSVSDPEVQVAIIKENRRQRCHIELIASKNYLSHAGRQALGSIFAFTSGQGYPGHRDRGGILTKSNGWL
jgi:glycine/serine hydroxymethyltransferase